MLLLKLLYSTEVLVNFVPVVRSPCELLICLHSSQVFVAQDPNPYTYHTVLEIQNRFGREQRRSEEQRVWEWQTESPLQGVFSSCIKYSVFPPETQGGKPYRKVVVTVPVELVLLGSNQRASPVSGERSTTELSTIAGFHRQIATP